MRNSKWFNKSIDYLSEPLPEDFGKKQAEKAIKEAFIEEMTGLKEEEAVEIDSYEDLFDESIKKIKKKGILWIEKERMRIIDYGSEMTITLLGNARTYITKEQLIILREVIDEYLKEVGEEYFSFSGYDLDLDHEHYKDDRRVITRKKE